LLRVLLRQIPRKEKQPKLRCVSLRETANTSVTLSTVRLSQSRTLQVVSCWRKEPLPVTLEIRNALCEQHANAANRWRLPAMQCSVQLSI
jgi:hypothetical protein